MKIFELIKSAPDDVLWSFANDVHTMILELYFEKYWDSESMNFEMSGDGLEDRVNAHDPKSVLDVGCGFNYWKGKIQNLTGIDPYNNAADIKVGIVEYAEKYPEAQHDAVLVLGSVNFGDMGKIHHEMMAIDKITAPGGRQYWRANPGLTDHPCDKFPLNSLIDFFPWDEKIVHEIAKVYGYEVEDYAVEKNKINGRERLYFVYRKSL